MVYVKKTPPEGFDPSVHAHATEAKPRNGVDFCGEFRRVIVREDTTGATSTAEGSHRVNTYIDLKLGDLPALTIARNVEVIVPIEHYNTLKDMNVEILDHNLNVPLGQPVRVGTRMNIRAPISDLGPATLEEYKAQIEAHRARPVYDPKVLA